MKKNHARVCLGYEGEDFSLTPAWFWKDHDALKNLPYLVLPELTLGVGKQREATGSFILLVVCGESELAAEAMGGIS